MHDNKMAKIMAIILLYYFIVSMFITITGMYVNREKPVHISKLHEGEHRDVQYKSNRNKRMEEKEAQKAAKEAIKRKASEQAIKDAKVRIKEQQRKYENKINLLSKIVSAEARDEPYAGKVAVANVILNRVHNENFPDTLSGVIYESGQFQPVSNGSINNAPDNDSVRAARQVLNNHTYTGILYFYNPETAQDTWITTRPAVKQIGNHIFAR